MIVLIKFLWHSDLRDSLNHYIKFHFSVALKLTAGIHFNRSIDFNGIQHKLQQNQHRLRAAATSKKQNTCDHVPHMIAIPDLG